MEKNRKILILIGISGSGKSTFATNFIKENPEYLRVNRDDIRKQITGSSDLLLGRDMENIVSKIQDETIRTILLEGKSIILDNTHLQQKYIDEILLKYNHLADIELKKFSLDVEKCKLRVHSRDNILMSHKALTYIDKQHKNYLKLDLEKSKFPKTKYINPTASYLPDCIICDLDGTLSLYGDKNAYDRDFENDQINYPVLNIIENSGVDHIFFFSGRNGKFRKQTERFLEDYIMMPSYTLVMRDSKDMRRDSIIKEEMYMKYIENKYNVDYVIDDRLQVIEECWNKLGIFVLNVNQNNKRF